MPKRDVSTVEAIRAYELGDTKIELTEHQLDYMQKLETTFGFLNSYKQRGLVIKKIMQLFSVSRSTAFNYIRDASELWFDPYEVKKDALRYQVTENQLQLLDIQMQEIARQKKAGEDVTASVEVASRINERISKLNRLGENENDIPDFASLQRHKVFIIIPSPEQIAQFEDVMDIPYEIVSNELAKHEG